MLNQNPKHYFNQVAMIQSQYESKRKQPSNASSLMNNRSPLRDRENLNSINTPSRINNKISLSPLRSRRADQSLASVRSNAISRRKQQSCQNFCENHPNKVAAFAVEEGGQSYYFCEKCSIPLITNNYKVIKIGESKQENPRIKQIKEFLKSLQKVDSSFSKKKNSINQGISKGQGAVEEEIQRIEEYYEQFFQIITEHKRRVLEEIKVQFEKASEESHADIQKIQEALHNSNNMREDIESSMNSVILEVDDRDFRSVMDEYYFTLQNFKAIISKPHPQEIKIRSLSFKDSESTCQALMQGLEIEWDDENQKNDESAQQIETERENPIECLETEEKGKNNLKQLKGLFCSFDQ